MFPFCAHNVLIFLRWAMRFVTTSRFHLVVVENRAMPRLAVLPISVDHPHIFVLDALAAGRPNHPQEHGFLRNLSLGYQQTNQFVAIINNAKIDNSLSLRFDENSVPAQRKSMT